MLWQSPRDIVEHFGLTVDDDEAETVRKAIRRRIAEIHPDSNAGKTDDALWQQLTNAKEFLETYRNDSTALIPVSQLPALIQALSLANDRASNQSPADRVRDSTRIDIKRRVFFPRISSGVFAAICAFLFAFPKTIKDNPLLDAWFEKFVSPAFLLGALLYSAAIFVLTWIAERSEEARIEWLMTEAGLEETLRRLCRDRPRSRDARVSFGLRDLARLHSQGPQDRDLKSRIVAVYIRVLSAFVFVPFGGLRYTVAEKVARGQLDTLLQQGMIREVPRSRFGRTYELLDSLFDEL